MRNQAFRRHKRLAKAIRRLKEDRAQHGSDRSCPCFFPDGRIFARFADYPRDCSCWMCSPEHEPTRQELRSLAAMDDKYWQTPRYLRLRRRSTHFGGLRRCTEPKFEREKQGNRPIWAGLTFT